MADGAKRVHHLPENSSSILPLPEGSASQKEPNTNKLATWTAVLSALLACIAAIVGYQAAGVLWLFAFSLLGGITGLGLACYTWWLL
jgi:hypothetical protein